MKNLFYILSIFFICACDNENSGNCFQKEGDIVQQEYDVPNFNKILVNRGIELIITEGATQSVSIKTGLNLLSDISVVVEGDRLLLTDNNTCNYVRPYGVTKAYITSPNITEIRSSTQYDIRSVGILTYPDLIILSEDFKAPDTFTNGDFKLQINNNSFQAVFNNLSNCFISGKTENLNVTLASGTSRFNGRNLLAQNVDVWNRSSNDIIVNPQQSITGKISGIGDVVVVNTPLIIKVDQVYKGKLIFE